MKILFAIFAICCSFFNVSPSAAESDSAAVEAARKEASVVYYTGLNVNAAQKLIQAFEKKYPFLKVQLARHGHVQLRTKIFTEAQTSAHRFDVVSMPAIELQLLKKKGILASHRSPEVEGIPTGLRDQDGFWTAMYITQFIPGYNTRMLTRDQVPKSWEELLKPQWKQKIGLDPDAPLWYASLLEYWGREKTIRVMKGLAAQEPHLRRGYTLLAQMVIAGEFPVAIVHAHKVEELKAGGAPIDWVKTVDPVVTSGHAIAVSARAPHAHAARLFADFILSKEGQTGLHQAFLVPARTDIPPLVPSLDQTKLKVHYVQPSLADQYDRHDKEFHEIFRTKTQK
ncbi:MAG: extracellular solute-binding protein [Deltaproteobacteria bacterium]|nr:extracellular solute-binding protein [Deltaproteobacteria bacterium]